MNQPQYIFSFQNLSKTYDKTEVLKGISLSFLPGAKIGLIGHNGAGKTTLLKLVAGVETPTTGSLVFAEDITVGYVPQEPRLDPEKNVRENVEAGLIETRRYLHRFEEIGTLLETEADPDKMQALLDEMAEVQEKIDHLGGWEIDLRVEIAMEALRTPPGDSEVGTLSGGEKRRIALARTLLAHPDILLLDEPTNHLDADSVEWLEAHLRDYQGTVILITHDRYFLDRVVGWMLEIYNGAAIPYEGNYSSFLEQKSARLAAEKRGQAKRRKHIDRELAWVRSSPKARAAKNRARLKRYDQLLEEEYAGAEDDVDLQIPPGPRLAARVLTFKNVYQSFGERTLIENFSFDLPRGAIVGVVGPNGTGKSTLMKLITGEVEQDSGTIEHGAGTNVVYVDQSREDLDASKTVFEEISGGAEWIPFGDRTIHARGYVSRFNFRSGDQQKKVGDLSGGQRNRVQLAKLLRLGANVLLLDEPTNDLDLQTLRVLEDALVAFAGCVIVVSHDRWFLDRVATSILAFEGDGQVRWFQGGYSDYAARRKEELEEAGTLRKGPRRRLH